jgi:6,7-dimethyl-8-ribityllumazine synthase
MAQYEGKLAGAKLKVALLASRFNSAITEQLIAGATDELVRHGTAAADIDTYRVPGAFDLPATARRLADGGRYDAIVCLGAVIRGATPHFEYVAAEATKGIAQVAQSAACAVVFGVLTCDHMEQAWERAGGKGGNRGADAARAALELVDLHRHIGKGK